MKKQFLVYIFIMVSSTLYAQLYEIGGFIGGTNYIGDIGSTSYINPNRIGLGLVGKFNFSPRITFRGTLKYTDLDINNTKVNRPIAFTGGRHSADHQLVEGGLGIEFNFFKYNLAKTGFTQTPYIIAQAGLALYGVNTDKTTTPTGTTFTRKVQASFVLPFGIGYKMKLAEKVGIAFETTFTYTFKDVLDGNNHTIPELSFGNPNSDDWYVFTGISIVYAFGRPGCYSGSF